MIADSTWELTSPNLLVSRCLNQENCRYNAEVLQQNFLNELLPHIKSKLVCPEVEMGMPTPRPPIHIITQDSTLRLHQPQTGDELLEEMNEFAPRRLDSCGVVDGFFMKARSPSCGIFDTRYFSDEQAKKEKGQGPGAFTSHALKRYPELPFADESLLKISSFRESFLTALFASARIRTYPGTLADFHNEYKLLLRLRNPQILSLLEQLVKVDNKVYYRKLCLITLRQFPDPILSGEIDKNLKARLGNTSSNPAELLRYLNPYPSDLKANSGPLNPERP